MRTTLNIDDDVLQAARALARDRRETTGTVLSDLARLALELRGHQPVRSGVPLLARPLRGTRRPTMGLVNRLCDKT